MSEPRAEPLVDPSINLKSATSPWTWLRVIYAVLLLGVLAFPAGMVDWLDERNADGWLAAPLAIARGIEAVSSAVGVEQAGQVLRKGFTALVGDTES
jgi:hypothetical protein